MLRDLCSASFVAVSIMLSPVVSLGQSPKADSNGSKNGAKPVKQPAPIVIEVENSNDVHKLLPKKVYMSPERYKALLKQIKDLQNKLEPNRLPPNQCALEAEVKGNRVHVKAAFILVAYQDNQTVSLGCGEAQLTAASLNKDEFPALRRASDGYEITLRKAGLHHLQLVFQIALRSRSLKGLTGEIESSITLGLPGATVTTFKLNLPDEIREITWNGAKEKGAPSAGGKRLWQLTLGESKKLTLTWVESIPGFQSPAQKTAEWKVSVELFEHRVVTQAHLKFDDPRGNNGNWRLFLPANAELEILEPAAKNYKLVRDRSSGFVSITGPPTKTLKALATFVQKRPFRKIPVGPFLALDAGRQPAVFNVKADNKVLRGSYLHYSLSGNLRRQDIPPGMAGAPEYQFQSLDLAYGIPLRKLKSMNVAVGINPPLQLDLRSVQPFLESSVDHEIVLRRDGADTLIHCTSHVEVDPSIGEIEYLEVILPGPPSAVGYLFTTLCGNGVTGFPAGTIDVATRLSLQKNPLLRLPDGQRIGCRSATPGVYAELRPLAGSNGAQIILHTTDRNLPRENKRIRVALIGDYVASAGLRRVRLPLVRPVALRDNGGKITIRAYDNLNLVESPFATGSAVARSHSQAFRRAPDFLDLSWQVRPPQIPVKLSADITVRQRHVHVEQRMRFDFLPAAVTLQRIGNKTEERRIAFRLPKELTALQLLHNGKFTTLDHAQESVTVDVGTDGTAVFSYDIPIAIPADEAKQNHQEAMSDKKATRFPVHIAFLQPLLSMDLTSAVRIWGEPGNLPDLQVHHNENRHWRETNAAATPGKSSWPIYSLATTRADPSLVLQIAKDADGDEVILIDHGMIIAQTFADGGQSVRSRYLIRHVRSPFLELELPAAVDGLSLTIGVNQKEVAWEKFPGAANVIKVTTNPAWAGKGFLLDVFYKLSHNEMSSRLPGWIDVSPPRFLQKHRCLRGVRWLVYAPPTLVSLPFSDCIPSPQNWSWRGWLLAPRPQWTQTETETWLTGGSATNVRRPAALAFATGQTQAVAIFQIPMAVWLILCSGGVFIFGMGILLRSPMRFVFWGCIFVACLSLALTFVQNPQVFYLLIFGMQPGMVLLAVFLALRWVIHRRYQSQAKHLPSFMRLKPKSDAHGSAQAAPPRAPSTVDAVSPAGSGLSHTGKDSAW